MPVNFWGGFPRNCRSCKEISAGLATLQTPEQGPLHDGGMSQYTEEESDAIRAGLMAAVALISKADSGIIAMFQESAAAGKTLKSLPPELKGIFSEFDLPRIHPGSELTALREALVVVDTKGGDTAQAYREAIREATRAAAQASRGTSQAEQDALDQIEAVLSAGSLDQGR